MNFDENLLWTNRASLTYTYTLYYYTHAFSYYQQQSQVFIDDKLILPDTNTDTGLFSYIIANYKMVLALAVSVESVLPALQHQFVNWSSLLGDFKKIVKVFLVTMAKILRLKSIIGFPLIVLIMFHENCSGFCGSKRAHSVEAIATTTTTTTSE